MSCIVAEVSLNGADTMFNAKKLTDDQITTLKGWADDGAQLADIQKRMEGEMDLRLTYMDTRFLILDLGIEIRNLEEEAKAEAAAQEAENPTEGGDAAGNGAELTENDLEILPPQQEGGRVTVTVDEIARPGVMASGRVMFPGGQGGMWYVDEQGRLGVDPDTEGYQPTEADVMAFQRELQALMDKK
jgi:hypothetical protein